MVRISEEKRLLIGFVVVVVLFFSGCASNVPMAPVHEDHIAKSFKKDKKYANVYLCRNMFFGSAISEAIYVDDKFVELRKDEDLSRFIL